MHLARQMAEKEKDQYSSDTKPKGNEVIDKSNAELEIEALYRKNRNEFILFAQRYEVEEEDILDAYQDAILVYFQLIKSNKLKLKSSSPKTYLFSIGKFKLIDKIRSDVKLRNVMSELQGQNIEEIVPDFTLNERQEKLKLALKSLGATCRELLNLFYYQKCAIKKIRDDMGYKTENVVKAHKSRCIKKLKKILST